MNDPTAPTPPPRIPPRWFIVTAWAVHRALYRVTGGRKGLRRPRPGVYGMMRLHTVGRRTGRARVAIVADVEDGADIVTMAMNGWGEPPPAWWINLQAHPVATIDLPGGSRAVRASEATGAERERLWAVFQAHEKDADLDALARMRGAPTPLVVLRSAER
ncbi:nitroreductase/quinone reductase family protein [Microcella flavibacter]|uniref:nitroreductase/quinone reductase family protein n=1 Tax=Microcella flavibacter TaxID=1804990 RepID=UPI001E52EB2C|nr:nitroreductase/quinone reductase family protein [Microcella flavibacter]